MNSTSFGQIDGLFNTSIYLSGFADELPVGITIMDLDQNVLFINQPLEVLSGFAREEVLGVPCRNVLRSNICHQKCPLLRSEESNELKRINGDIINRDRQKIPVRLTAVPINDVEGNRVGFLETVEDLRELQRIDDDIQQLGGFGQLLGRSPKMEELFRLIPVIAQTDSSILITGETGTGKDVVAEVIHKASERVKGSFVKINCGALPETLLESELFGHKKGAFTGAVSDKMGRLRLAHNGTLYLTEIGDLPLSLQVKLLTFLDDKVVQPLGSTNGFQTDVRIIAATHRNLEKMVKEDHFRQDLLFRLNVVRLQLPALRDRGDDIDLLLDHFLSIFSTKFGKKVTGFSQTVRQLLLNYAYPGNVRELRNITEYAINICPSERVEMEHLPAYITEKDMSGHADFGRDTVVSSPINGETRAQISGRNWADIERQHIIDTLLKVKGRRSKAAEILGWGRTTLWRKMKQYGLEA